MRLTRSTSPAAGVQGAFPSHLHASYDVSLIALQPPKRAPVATISIATGLDLRQVSMASVGNDVCIYVGEVSGTFRLYRVRKTSNNSWERVGDSLMHQPGLVKELRMAHCARHGGNVALITSQPHLWVVELDARKVTEVESRGDTPRPGLVVSSDRLIYATSLRYVPPTHPL